jgi:hypothetical protein
MNFDIEQFLDITDYATETRKSRRKNSSVNSQEFFTPYSIVKRMCDKIDEQDWADPQKTFCEPCFGNGQFVVYIIWNRLQHGIDWRTALETLYGVELMQDNVYETHGRIIKLFDALGIDYDEDVAMDIMLRNLVCSDFFEWNFNEWRKYTPEELKLINRKHAIKHKNLVS